MRRLLLGLVVAVATLVPNLANGNDQAIARHIMSKLQLEQQRGTLKGFHVDMRVDRGTVWYKGFVSNQQQKDLILRTAQRAKNLGVVQVVDDITVRPAQSSAYRYQPSMAPGNQPMAANHPAMATYNAQPAVANTPVAARTPVAQQTGYMQYDVTVPQPGANIPSPQAAATMHPAATRAPLPANMIQQQPMPMARSASAPMPMSGDNASVPGYAWPTYAAHPNYGAVTYPQQYSPSAWPYIGPFYPYPQVPLGWRKVTLEWDDGWWYLDFHNR